MRILWLDTSSSPWKQGDGWEYLGAYQLDFIRVADSASARAQLSIADLVVINVDVDGAEELVQELKGGDSRATRVILISEKWTKKEFKTHSLSPYAADNYARLPMPASGFLDVVAGLMNTTRDALANPAPIPPVIEDPSALILMAEKPKSKSPMQAIKEAITPWKKSESRDDSHLRSPQLRATPTPAPGPKKPLPQIEPLGAYHQSDADVLRKYLTLREQELSRSLIEKQSLDELYSKVEREAEELRKQLRDFERERSEALGKGERLEKRYGEQEKQISELKEKAEFERETLRDRIKLLEAQLAESKERYSSLKDRVRKDIRKIQTREKELETRLELVKRDSEALTQERDRQVLELKRKIDALEFDLDLIQDRKAQAEENAHKYVDKLSRVARTLEVAFGMLEEEEEVNEAPDSMAEPILGGAALARPSDESDLEKLLKTPAKDLKSEELAQAEAATQIFGNSESSPADDILSGVGEEATGQDNADDERAIG
jgi:DNA repair exonuclease SbcCD ATPase subunit